MFLCPTGRPAPHMSDSEDDKWSQAIGCLRILLFLVCLGVPVSTIALGPLVTLGVSFGAILVWSYATPNVPGFDVYGDAGFFICMSGIVSVLVSMFAS